MGNKLVPTTWMGREMLPMEFAVVPEAFDAPVVGRNLAADLVSVLASAQCEGLFGIDVLGEEDWMELKVGNASVVVPSNGHEKEEAYLPVAFAFDDKKPGFRVHGKCGTDHKHTSKP
ncbi:hypothetical protein H9Q74_011864 [Fusarium xylarioides]|nr:hypothetical protein H9Q71_006591 [Fusarium xylarioides]KAG5815143.1 hypothetical protein H9Q74_011864 [Fusarium xylarioides]